jgi:riboflavin synthase
VFTGIVEELGAVVAVERLEEEAARLTLRAARVLADARHGDSIAVNGVCLTVAASAPDEGTFTADVMKETLDRTSLGGLRPGDPVNLERSATLATRLGGHLVQGHVDGVGTVRRREPAKHWELVEIDLPPALARYVVEKGSIAVDGVSLTVAALHSDPGGDLHGSFTVSLIPTTLELTTLGRRKPGDAVNLEVDVIAKYVERLLPGGSQ